MGMIDNDKMWASILKRAKHIKDRTLFNFIKWSLQEQGLRYNPETKEIERIVLNIEAGKFYMCLKNHLLFQIGKLYYSNKDGYLIDDEQREVPWAKECACDYFRPATEEELRKIAKSKLSASEAERICNDCQARHDKDKCDELVFGRKCPLSPSEETKGSDQEELTDKEKIKVEIERLKESGCASPIVICDTLLTFIDALPEEPVSGDLEEAATTFADVHVYATRKICFKAGAKWREEKYEMLKKLADAMYYAARYLSTDASRLHKAMEEYHQFIITQNKE